MGENKVENNVRPQNKHLKPLKKGETANPNGRPKGQRNYKTIQREALIKIGSTRGMSLEEVETMIQEVGLLKAMKGDYNFYRDYMDRTHGKVPDKTQLHVTVEPNERIKALAKKLNK